MKKIYLHLSLFVILLVAFSLISCGGQDTAAPKKSGAKKIVASIDPLVKEANSFSKALPSVMLAPGATGLSPAMVKLGKSLFHDTRLSKSGAFSCNSCHSLASYGVDNRSNSIGHNFKTGGRNAPTVYNAALHIAQFWDGREPDVEAQAKGPVLNPIEMASPNESFVVDRLKSIPGYIPLFKGAFPGEANPITYGNMARAIGAFERTLVTPARFDKFLQGDSSALSDQEKNGLKLFKSIGCASCHNGAALGGNSYQKFGAVNAMKKLTDTDKGRGLITKKADQNYFFKVPSLRNIDRTYPYFHTGSVWTLEEAVTIMANVQLGVKLKANERDDIVAFLKSLTGEIPSDALKLPILPPSGKGTSKPKPYQTLTK